MSKTALLVIDVQKGFDDAAYWGRRNNPQAEANIARLIAVWREKARPLIHIKHNSTEPNSPLRPELPGNAFKDAVRPLPSEKQFSKTVNSAFIGTGLTDYLHEQGIDTLIVVGLTTDHCVSTSVRMAANLGFAVTLVGDATATHERIGYDGVHYAAEQIHKINLVSLGGEFCTIRTTDDLLQEISRR